MKSSLNPGESLTLSRFVTNHDQLGKIFDEYAGSARRRAHATSGEQKQKVFLISFIYFKHSSNI